MQKQIDHIQKKKDILQYWSQVEFFQPYFLDSVIDRQQKKEYVYRDTPCTLPWEYEKTLEQDSPINPMKIGYQVYFGIFNIEETADRARHVFCKKPNSWQSIEWKQSLADNSVSCFARLSVTIFGTPLIRTLSLSTVPWAHGHFLEGKTSHLTMEAFQKSGKRMLQDLDDSIIEKLGKQIVKLPNEWRKTLIHQDIVEITQTLFEWANFCPMHYPAAIIVPVQSDEAITPKEKNNRDQIDIPILNSFYIQDIERSMSSLDPVETPALNQYLEIQSEMRILLEEEKGVSQIIETLQPEKLPKGRWPANPKHQLSLMQQFAVNHVLHNLPKGGVFSINGPPGTGKSTLLREVIADNIVSRARALSKFDTASDTFTTRHHVGFGDADSVSVYDFHESLKGFEMVVASSNNTAVQNLSHELPLRQELDSNYHFASYLEPVASRLLNAKNREAWGLIAAALGNRVNCNRVVESIFIHTNSELPGKRIWEWAKEYDGPSFEEAREKFLVTESMLDHFLEEVETLNYLYNELFLDKIEDKFELHLNKLCELEDLYEEKRENISKAELEVDNLSEILSLIEKKEHLWKAQKPSIYKRFIEKNKWKLWSERSAAYAEEKIHVINRLQSCKEFLKSTRDELIRIDLELETDLFDLLDQSLKIELMKNRYEDLKPLMDETNLLRSDSNLESSEMQIQGYFQTKEINQLRSTLFFNAMTLHEAWLAEICKKGGGFGGNLVAISKLLQGKSPTTADDSLLIWQSLFMVIPVISSTFASVEKLFRLIGSSSLGWAFIDEAGQALPQAAVGIIWRSQKVLSIGDPFQIEPISTTPPEIIDGMAKHVLNDHCLTWAPSSISVQHCMDNSTIYGSQRVLRERYYWLGAPLRVHRRCQEPMFSISNEIAYSNTMIKALSTDGGTHYSESCWYDVKGGVSHKHWVPSQGEKLIEEITILLRARDLPDLFVISPFREVVFEIRSLLSNHQKIKPLFEKKFPEICFKAWVSRIVGTVHTFQGKQATLVFFVLGGDHSTLGAVEWASSKPNLLNVAVTRARQRFYIIGDYELWRNRQFFDVAAKYLPLTSSSP